MISEKSELFKATPVKQEKKKPQTNKFAAKQLPMPVSASKAPSIQHQHGRDEGTYIA